MRKIHKYGISHKDFRDIENIHLIYGLKDRIESKYISLLNIMEPQKINLNELNLQNHIIISRNDEDLELLFNNFNTFNYIDHTRKLSKISSNAGVYNIKFRDGKISYSVILKISQNPIEEIKLGKKTIRYLDNLYYEYKVGQCINILLKYVPNFIKTLNLVRLNSDQDRNELLTKYILPSNEISNYIKSVSKNRDYTIDSCELPTQFGIFNEYIPSDETIHEYIYKFSNPVHKLNSIVYKFMNQCIQHLPDICSILFMTYACLYKFRNIFTHYDLHSANVLLYRIPYGYIEMNYHIKIKNINHIIKFKSKYIPIIIDYGRSYINCDIYTTDIIDNGSITVSDIDNSVDIFEKVCNLDSYRSKNGPCRNHCGDMVGYPNVGNIIDKPFILPNIELLKQGKKGIREYYNEYDNLLNPFSDTTYSRRYLNAAKKNISADLLLLSDIAKIDFSDIITDKKYINTFIEMLRRLNYDHNIQGKQETQSKSGEINNCVDVFNILLKIIMDSVYQNDMDKFYDKSSEYGKMNIYISEDIPYTFNKSN